MSLVQGKNIADGSIKAEDILLSNNSYLQGRNAANNANINLIKVNASDVPELAAGSQVSGTPSAANDIVNKAYADSLTGAVDSVNGQTGVVVLDSDDISEGASNLYFTTSRARTAAVADAINNGTTDVAPSQNAVFDALALKQDAFSWGKESNTLDGTDITNQYVDLAETIKASSLDLVFNGLVQREGTDYTVSLTGGAGGVTRITFAGDLATGGGSALVSGDVLYFKYNY